MCQLEIVPYHNNPLPCNNFSISYLIKIFRVGGGGIDYFSLPVINLTYKNCILLIYIILSYQTNSRKKRKEFRKGECSAR